MDDPALIDEITDKSITIILDDEIELAGWSKCRL